MDQTLMSFAESSESHCMFSLRSARNKESIHVSTFQASSIFGFRLSYTKSWR